MKHDRKIQRVNLTKKLRTKWLPILRGIKITPEEVAEFMEDVERYKTLNPGDTWRKINLLKL